MAVSSENCTIRIGGANGYWGESDMGLPQLLQVGNIDYIVFDYLAEITMSILARARARKPDLGYATDFISNSIKPHIAKIAETGTKILSNAGGVNPKACAQAIRNIVQDAGLDLKVAVVLGDDLTNKAADFSAKEEMFSGARFPDPAFVASINAYLGAFPIAAALQDGADIVVTGRCVDSALTLAACLHAFEWSRSDWDRLASGSLAGHLLECGPQSTGGNFTDWDGVADTLIDAGYPIANISNCGEIVISKPPASGGTVNIGTVSEQLVYEIGDPQTYILPDVICDFSQVELQQSGENEVTVKGAVGRSAPKAYKTSATFNDGWKISTNWLFVGEDASSKARSFAETMLKRTARKLEASNLGSFTETHVETLGDESHFGAFATGRNSREVSLKVAAKHSDPDALQLLLKEGSGLALAAPPGLALFTGGRPKPSPVVRLFSFLVDKSEVSIEVHVDDHPVEYTEAHVAQSPASPAMAHSGPVTPSHDQYESVPLRQLAWGRSGDKGNNANIGIIPRNMALAPWIWSALTPDTVAERFAHFLQGPVERFFMPGTGATNLLLHDVLGGGGMASLRNDPQGKSFAQILLDIPIKVPTSLLKETVHARL